MDPPHRHPYMIQAWAFACEVRQILNKSPPMNMNNFPADVWYLHRRLHHRFLKQQNQVRAATHKLSEYKQRLKHESKESVKNVTTAAASSATSTATVNLLCLLTDSSGDDSTTEEEVPAAAAAE